MASFKVLWRLTLTNVKFFEFLKSPYTKSKSFSTKTKLFLKVGTCKTLEMICKTLKIILGVRTIHPKFGVFFKIFKIKLCLLLYYPVVKNSTAIVFIWGDREYPATHFEYKTATERYLVAELWAKQFWVFFQNVEYKALFIALLRSL